MNSAGSGALMSGIFYGLGFAAQAILPLVPALAPLAVALHFSLIPAIVGAGLMVGAVGLFGGVMALKREGEEAKAAAATTVSHSATRARSQEVTPVMVPVMGASMNADEAPAQTNWAERTGGRSNDRIQQILANGSLSDKDRAGAILAEREAAAAQGAQRA